MRKNQIYNAAAQQRRTLEKGLPWTPGALAALGLPLYGSEVWVREQLADGQSWVKIAALAGGNHPSRTVHHWCSKWLDLPQTLQKSRLHRGRGADARELVAAGHTRESAGKLLGISSAGAAYAARGLPKHARASDVVSAKFWARVAALSWPADLEQISRVHFGGDRLKASWWATAAQRSGYFVRLERGVYNLAYAAIDKLENRE